MSPHVPDLAIGLATVIGLGVVIWQVSGQRDIVLGHLRRMMILAAVFYTARNVAWISDSALARSIEIGAAALLPLFVLLTVEAFLRRHAPGWIKAGIAGLGVILALLALVPSNTVHGAYISALVLYQVGSFALILWLTLRRDRNSLSEAENAMIDRIGIGLLVMLPLLLSDYRDPSWPTPASMSGIAVLITCWILVHLGDREFHRRRMLGELALLFGFSVLAAILVQTHAGVGWFVGAQMWAILFALTLTAAVIVGCFRLRWRSTTRMSVTRGLTRSQDVEAYLADLQSNGLSEHILGPDLLSDFDQRALLAIFDQRGAVALADLPKNPEDDTMGQSQIRALFARSGTVQAYLVTRDPLRIAVGLRYGMAQGPDPELLAAFGLSRLIAERDAAKDTE